MFLPDLGKLTGLEWLSHQASQLEPILKSLAFVAGSFAFVKWLRERNNRATDVLLQLEAEFDKKCAKGRRWIEHDWKYDQAKDLLEAAVESGERSANSVQDADDPQTAIDNLLRFYVVLVGVRQARQIPPRSLSICYRFWLSHYYRTDRLEFRRYINLFFPTLRAWLLADCSWSSRLKRNPFSRWWRSFFTPGNFWAANEIERNPMKLNPDGCGRVFMLTGSGISAESGISTFRGLDGYWRKLDQTKLATEKAFRANPELIWDWYRERRELIRKAEPNAAHNAIVKLARYSREFLLVTQNVDDLHGRARWKGKGLSQEQIVQIHGDIFVTRCTKCSFRRRDRHEDEEGVPKCPECNGPMRPGTVWFDEELDPLEEKRVRDFLAKGSCELVIVTGTTATFDYIVEWARTARGETGQLIEINPETSGLSHLATRLLRKPAGSELPRVVDHYLEDVQIA